MFRHVLSLKISIFHQNIFYENQQDSCNRKNSLDESKFHYDRGFFLSFVLEKVMKRCNSKKLSFEGFFPEDLEEARADFYDEDSKND